MKLESIYYNEVDNHEESKPHMMLRDMANPHERLPENTEEDFFPNIDQEKLAKILAQPSIKQAGYPEGETTLHVGSKESAGLESVFSVLADFAKIKVLRDHFGAIVKDAVPKLAPVAKGLVNAFKGAEINLQKLLRIYRVELPFLEETVQSLAKTPDKPVFELDSNAKL